MTERKRRTKMVDNKDLEIAKNHPINTLEKRSLRILDYEIDKLERQLTGLRFVRDTMERHSKL